MRPDRGGEGLGQQGSPRHHNGCRRWARPGPPAPHPGRPRRPARPLPRSRQPATPISPRRPRTSPPGSRPPGSAAARPAARPAPRRTARPPSPDHPHQPLQRQGDVAGVDRKPLLQVVGAQHQQHQIQRLVAFQQRRQARSARCDARPPPGRHAPWSARMPLGDHLPVRDELRQPPGPALVPVETTESRGPASASCHACCCRRREAGCASGVLRYGQDAPGRRGRERGWQGPRHNRAILPIIACPIRV
jgi:hypothetical protein